MHNINTKNLVFPTLALHDFDEHDTPCGRAHVYSLDWRPLEKARRNSFDRWWKKHGKARAEKEAAEGPDEYGTVQKEYNTALPAAYDAQIKNMYFLLDKEYQREIVHHARLALLEWTKDRCFDTSIRDICLEPAIKHVEVAFTLIADCLFDPDTKKRVSYKRDISNYWKHAALYKFWHRQTGSGLLWGFSGMKRLERLVKRNEATHVDAKAFLEALKEHKGEDV